MIDLDKPAPRVLCAIADDRLRAQAADILESPETCGATVRMASSFNQLVMLLETRPEDYDVMVIDSDLMDSATFGKWVHPSAQVGAAVPCIVLLQPGHEAKARGAIRLGFEELLAVDDHQVYECLLPSLVERYAEVARATLPCHLGGHIYRRGETRPFLLQAGIRRRKTAFASTVQTAIDEYPNSSVILIDREMRFNMAEGLGLAMLGVNSGKVSGKPLREVMGEETFEVLEVTLHSVFEGKAELLHVPFANRIFLCHATPLHDDNGEIIAAVLLLQDMTRQLKVEARDRDRRKPRVIEAAG